MAGQVAQDCALKTSGHDLSREWRSQRNGRLSRTKSCDLPLVVWELIFRYTQSITWSKASGGANDEIQHKELEEKNQINAKSPGQVRLLVLSLFIAGILFLVFEGTPNYLFLRCTQLLFQPILLALGSTVAIDVLLALFWRHALRLSLLVLSALFLVALFLGSYRYSPLSLSKGDAPILHGFLITRQGRVNEVVDSGDVLLLSAGIPAAISIRSDLRDMSCRWISRNGGAWDDPLSCDTLYVPPAADFDTLTVMIEPGCKLPPVRGQIKISILP